MIEGQFFLTTDAGLAVSIVGFAALMVFPGLLAALQLVNLRLGSLGILQTGFQL